MNANGVRDPGNDQFGEVCSEEGHVHGCPCQAGGDPLFDAAPDPEWFEGADGFVRAPLSYENREGDPTLNGALDKW